MNTNNKVLVQDLGSSRIEPLNCIVNSSFNVQIEKNSSYQIEFTAYDDGSAAFNALTVETSVFCINQEFVIKQIEYDYEGTMTAQVTATHVGYEVYKIFQRNTQSGNYTPQQILDFYLKGNSLGFTYEVDGSFTAMPFQNLGNTNAKDALSNIFDTWADAVFYPDNKNIRIYQNSIIAKNLGNRIDYLKDSDDFELEYDSSNGIVNQLRVTSPEKEKTNDTDDSTPQYYFDPFYVSDSNSIAKYGVHDGGDVTDDSLTNADIAKTYATNLLVPQPSLSITVNEISDQVPTMFEVRRLEIRTAGIVINVQLCSLTYYPFDSSQKMQMVFNSNAANVLSYQRQQQNKLLGIIRKQQQLTALQAQTISKQASQLNDLDNSYSNLSTNYKQLAETVQDIINNNGIWVPGRVFVDVSSNNADDSVSWFTSLVKNGAVGLIVKLSQSTDYTNSLAADQIANAKAAGMSLIGGYHYFMGNGAAEGKYFLAQLQTLNVPKTAIVACDIEDSSIDPTKTGATITKAELNTQIAAFYKALTDAGYTNTCDYASTSRFSSWFDSAAKYKWIADYDASSRPDGADAWQISNDWNSLGVDASKSYSKAFV